MGHIGASEDSHQEEQTDQEAMNLFGMYASEIDVTATPKDVEWVNNMLHSQKRNEENYQRELKHYERYSSRGIIRRPTRTNWSATDYMTRWRLQFMFAANWDVNSEHVLNYIVNTQDHALLEIARKHNLNLEDNNYLALRTIIDYQNKDGFAFLIKNGIDIDVFLKNTSINADILNGLSKLSGRPAHIWRDPTAQTITQISYPSIGQGDVVRLSKIFNFHARQITTLSINDNGASAPFIQNFDDQPTVIEIHEAHAALLDQGGTPPPLEKITGHVIKSNVSKVPQSQNFSHKP